MHTDNSHRTSITNSLPDQKGRKYAQHHIKGQKDQHLGQGEDKSHRHNQQCEDNEVVLGSSHQPSQRRPVDIACHHLETTRQENTTRETSQAVERRPGQILESHGIEEDNTIQANLEMTC